MPYLDPDPSDPSMIVGVGRTCAEDELREMAASFASEMAQLGYDDELVLRLFRQPFYVGPHLAWRGLGEEEVRRIVRESGEFWSHCRVVVKDRALCAAGLLRIDPWRT